MSRLEISHSGPCPGPQETFRGTGEDEEHDPVSVLTAARPPGSPVTVTTTGVSSNSAEQEENRRPREVVSFLFPHPLQLPAFTYRCFKTLECDFQ